MRTIGFIALIALAVTSQSAYGQACVDFNVRNCLIPDFTYFYDQQSASFEMKVGETVELKVIVFELTDYYVSLCAHRRFSNIQLRIIEDTPDRRILYDNSAETYIDSVKFTNDFTRKLIFEVGIPEEKNDKSDTRNRCVGIIMAKRIRTENI